MVKLTKIQEKENLTGELKMYLSQLLLAILKDPDFGLEIQEEVKKKLEKIRKGKVKFFTEKELRKKLKL